MVERASVYLLAASSLAVALPIAAQRAGSFAERERALQSQLAAQQEAEVVREQQREVVRERAAQQRDYAAQQRVYQQESAEHMRELASELSKAKAQLAASAAEIARLSGQLSRPVVREVQNSLGNLRLLGQRAILGIVIEDSDAGVRVTGVTPNGPAAAAGVQVGDTVVAIDGIDLVRRDGGVPPTAALLDRLDDVEAGENVELRIRRGGSLRNITVDAGESNVLPFRFEPGRYVSMPGGPGNVLQLFRGRWNDVELVSLTPALGEYFGVNEGLLVVRAGAMGELGLRDGDVLLEIGGREPQTPEHAMRILASFEPGEALQASIMRQRRRETLTMTGPGAAQRADGVF